jgi:hypothetical protein
MAPHLTKKELDRILILSAKGEVTTQILERIAASREKEGIEAPMPGAIQRAVKGKTHKRGRVETRGRKRKLSKASARKLDKTRTELIEKAKGEEEITWDKVIKKARVPAVHPSTAGRSLVRWRADQGQTSKEEADAQARAF